MESTNSTQPTAPKPYTKKHAIGCLSIIVIFLAWCYLREPTPHYPSGNHTCSWCEKSFTGNGYNHLMNDCYAPKTYNEDNKCSMKCCEEAWNSGHH